MTSRKLLVGRSHSGHERLDLRDILGTLGFNTAAHIDTPGLYLPDRVADIAWVESAS